MLLDVAVGGNMRIWAVYKGGLSERDCLGSRQRHGTTEHVGLQEIQGIVKSNYRAVDFHDHIGSARRER